MLNKRGFRIVSYSPATILLAFTWQRQFEFISFPGQPNCPILYIILETTFLSVSLQRLAHSYLAFSSLVFLRYSHDLSLTAQRSWGSESSIKLKENVRGKLPPILVFKPRVRLRPIDFFTDVRIFSTDVARNLTCGICSALRSSIKKKFD